MCKTEEQAIIYFRSKNRIIQTKKSIEDMEPIEKKKEAKLKDLIKEPEENLKIPKVPIFKSKLAKIMEQLPEALTWALSSQRCKKNKGILQTSINLIIKVKIWSFENQKNSDDIPKKSFILQ